MSVPVAGIISFSPFMVRLFFPAYRKVEGIVNPPKEEKVGLNNLPRG
jgi:hypothetical protein